VRVPVQVKLLAASGVMDALMLGVGDSRFDAEPFLGEEAVIN